MLCKLEQSQLPEHYAQSRYKEIYNTLDPRHRGKRARKARAQVTSYSRRDDMLYYHYDGRDNPLLVVPQYCTDTKEQSVGFITRELKEGL